MGFSTSVIGTLLSGLPAAVWSLACWVSWTGFQVSDLRHWPVSSAKAVGSVQVYCLWRPQSQQGALSADVQLMWLSTPTDPMTGAITRADLTRRLWYQTKWGTVFRALRSAGDFYKASTTSPSAQRLSQLLTMWCRWGWRSGQKLKRDIDQWRDLNVKKYSNSVFARWWLTLKTNRGYTSAFWLQRFPINISCILGASAVTFDT